MNFAKKLFLGSAIVMGAFGIIACGDDSSSTSAESGEGGSVIETPTKKDNIISFVNLGVVGSTSSKKFTGQVNIVLTDTTSTNPEALKFTKITAAVVKDSSDGNKYSTTVNITNPPSVSAGTSFDLAGIAVDLKDPTFTSCGKFALRITVKATDGVGNFESYEDIAFEREASYCATETPSSSSATPVPTNVTMTPCTVDLSTDVNPGLNIATCTAVPAAEAATADLIFSTAGTVSNAEMTVKSGTGLVFTLMTNTDDYEVGFWPEEVEIDRSPAAAYVTDFKYRAPIAGTEIGDLILNANQIYIAAKSDFNATTGVGFYPFAILEPKQTNNLDRTFKVKVYKVQ